ncbi:MAG: hypothetical protein QMC81_02855 [Thermoanaerobacterales bacterium]|nr:hypothetical protein [Thermoanaerobacterales bacterium]
MDYIHLQLADTTMRLLRGKVVTTFGRLTHRLAVVVSEELAVQTVNLLRRELTRAARLLQVPLFETVERGGFAFLESEGRGCASIDELIEEMEAMMETTGCAPCVPYPFQGSIALYHPEAWRDMRSAVGALRWLRRSRVLGVASVVVIVLNQAVPLVMNNLEQGLARETVFI